MARVTICLAALTAAMALAAARLVQAGGGQLDVNIDTDNGPAFFGFVREVDGPGVAGAKVSATVKDGNAVVTSTDILGIYKIPGVGKGVNPDDVTISCVKSGYTQADVVRRARADADKKDPIEIECYLRKQ